MNVRLRGVCVAVALLTTTGCATGGGGSAGGGSLSSPITAADLTPGRFRDVIDAITKLRPGWLNRVEGIFVEGHQVQADNLRLQALDAIGEIKLLRCEQAMVKFPVSCVSARYLEITRKRREAPL
jgi:hypothetical protein